MDTDENNSFILEFVTSGLNGTLSFGHADVDGTGSYCWLSCSVKIRVPGFEANYGCSVELQELELLRRQIAALLTAGEGNLSWSLMEMGIAFDLTLNRRGQVSGTYEFRQDSTGPCLTGSFQADQTHLHQWFNGLQSGLDHLERA